MSNSSRRPFTILDAMILVAATAVGLGLARGISDARSFSGGTADAVLLSAARWTVLGLPLIAAWTVALLLLLLKRPRPSLGELLQRPGAIACAAAALAMAFEAVNITALLAAVRFGRSRHLDVVDALVGCLINSLGIELGAPGLAVTVAWIMVATNGRWRPDPGWLDRAGRLLGMVWIILSVLAPWLTATLLGVWS